MVDAKRANEKRRRSRPKSEEARENQLIALATQLAEKQLEAGTASAQVITHYLRLGSTVERLEREKLKRENILLEAKAEALKSSKSVEDLYKQALNAMRKYGGVETDNDNFEDEV